MQERKYTHQQTWRRIAACGLLAFGMLLAQIIPLAAQEPQRNAGTRPKEGAATSDKRLALVIGNGAYQKTDALPNPVNDATDMAAALRSLGFEVLAGTDLTKKQMRELMRQFGDKLDAQKGVGLFYYAGHGIQVGGYNYLIPVEADIGAEDEVDDEAIKLDSVLEKMAVAEARLNIVILDACRNNPFARRWRTVRDTAGVSGGLANVRAPTGTLIAYATAPGETAADGKGRNGLYTGELLRQMKTPNVELVKVFQQVRAEVRQKSSNQQVPWESSSVIGDFYFSDIGGNVDSTSQVLLAPELVAPKENATYDIYPRTMKLIWEPVVGAVKYKLQLDFGNRNGEDWYSESCVRKNNGLNVYCYPIDVVATEYFFDFVGAQWGRWRVWGVDKDGREGLRSAWRRFKHKR